MIVIGIEMYGGLPKSLFGGPWIFVWMTPLLSSSWTTSIENSFDRAAAMEIELGGEEERLADAAGHVGNAEAGEHVRLAGKSWAGNVTGTWTTRALRAGVRGRLPERNALPAVDDARAA